MKDDKEYLNIAIKELNIYLDYLNRAMETFDFTADQIKKNHIAYRDYVNDVRKRCGKPPLILKELKEK